MKWPFVSRERFEEMRDILQKQIEELKRERNRLHDLVYFTHFKEQVFDSIAGDKKTSEQPKPEQEQELTELERVQREIKQRLSSVARTNPSRLGDEIERAMEEAARIQVETLYPGKKFVQPAQIFAGIRQEVAEAAPDLGNTKVNED